MERQAASRLLRALVAVGLRQRESMANAAVRTVAIQAEVDEFKAARRYAREQGWLIEGGKAFSTTLQTPKADDKAYNAALKSLPSKPFDPWRGAR
jgi:hypothetical protein